MRKFFKSYWILWRICNSVNPGKFFHSNSIGSPSIPITHWKNSQLEKLPHGLSIVQLLPLKYESFSRKIPNPRRHILFCLHPFLSVVTRNVELVHERLIQSRHLTCRISKSPIINLLVALNILSISSNPNPWIRPNFRIHMYCSFHRRYHKPSPHQYIGLISFHCKFW